jgi:hypothetical protein
MNVVAHGRTNCTKACSCPSAVVEAHLAGYAVESPMNGVRFLGGEFSPCVFLVLKNGIHR